MTVMGDNSDISGRTTPNSELNGTRQRRLSISAPQLVLGASATDLVEIEPERDMKEVSRFRRSSSLSSPRRTDDFFPKEENEKEGSSIPGIVMPERTTPETMAVIAPSSVENNKGKQSKSPKANGKVQAKNESLLSVHSKQSRPLPKKVKGKVYDVSFLAPVPAANLKNVPMGIATRTMRSQSDRSVSSVPELQLHDTAEYDAPSEEEPSTELQDKISEALTEDHQKLLYMIYLYSFGDKGQETWLRRLSLLVLIYEGILAKVFDYDYAPSPVRVANALVYVNISQEGRDDIDDLREEKFINGLKLSSTDHANQTCYRIAEGCEKIIGKIPRKYKKVVDDLVYAPGTLDLITVQWTGSEFVLAASGGYTCRSTITDIEDVSYVCSPYLPDVLLRHASRKLSSNAGKAGYVFGGAHSIRDTLDEVIHLDNVSLLIGEWVPFGSNHIVSLNDKLGSAERIQGGLFTSEVDSEFDPLLQQAVTGLTSVKILDFDQVFHLSFEAEINYKELPGIVQVESLGAHVRLDGTVCYGLHVDSVMDRIKDHISLDHLARLLTDVHQDSSYVMNSLLNPYQKSLMDTVFLGYSLAREKFNIIIADKISPFASAETYLDREAHENELCQVIGDVQTCHFLSDVDLLIIGRSGVLMAGPNAREHENLLLAYMSLNSRDIFLRSYWHRTFIFDDVMGTIRELILRHDENPLSIPRIRHLLSMSSRELILIESVLGYLHESLTTFHMPKEPTTESGSKLYKILKLQVIHAQLKLRVQDMVKNVHGSRQEIHGLREMADIVSETYMFKLSEAMHNNTRNLEDVFRSNERSSSSLRIMQVILVGSLAFDILDRITGDWSIRDTAWGTMTLDVILAVPFAWFFFNMFFWIFLALALWFLMRYLSNRSLEVTSVRIKVNASMNSEAFQHYLQDSTIQQQDFEQDPISEVRKYTWLETKRKKFANTRPRVEVAIDERNKFLLWGYMQTTRNHFAIKDWELRDLFLEEMVKSGVISFPDAQKLKSAIVNTDQSIFIEEPEQFPIEDVQSRKLSNISNDIFSRRSSVHSQSSLSGMQNAPVASRQGSDASVSSGGRRLPSANAKPPIPRKFRNV